MWKTTLTGKSRAGERGDLMLVLCPHCDALGPHPLEAQEMGWDAWMACIDCGKMLGRMTPKGFVPFEEERPEQVKGHGLERVQARRILQDVLQDAQADRVRRGRQTATRLGFII